MKTILRATLLNSLSIWLTSLVATGLVIEGGIATLLLAGFVLFLIQKLLKPILEVITLPINLATLGLFSWVLNIVALYLLTILVAGIAILPFTFQGSNISGFIIPETTFNQITAFIAVTLVLTIIQRFLSWLRK